MSERKVPRDGAVAVARHYAVANVRKGASARNGQIDIPRVATAKVSQSTLPTDARRESPSSEIPQIDTHCVATGGIRQSTLRTVAAARAKASSGGIRQIDTPRVATRNGVEYEMLALRPTMSDNKIAAHCGVDHKTVATVRRVSDLGIPKSDTSVPVLRTGADGRKIAEHCGVHHDTVAAARAKASSGGIRQIDTPRVATRNGVEYEALALRPNLSDRKIAAHCGVSPTTVGTIRRGGSTIQIGKSVTPAETLRTGADGRKIAEHCGVSDRMVNGVRAGLSSAKVSQIDTPRLGRDGATP